MKITLKYLFVIMSVCFVLGSCVNTPIDNSPENPGNEQQNGEVGNSPSDGRPNNTQPAEPYIAISLTEEEIAAKQDASMVEGHSYIHDGDKIHDLMELKYKDPMTIIDAWWEGFQSALIHLQTQPNTFIISFTVAGYSEQVNHGDKNSMVYSDYELHTALRIEDIHYAGENVSLNVGDTYEFYHSNAWVTQIENEYVYSIHPMDIAPYGVLRYEHQYIMSGYADSEKGKLYLNNLLWWNEICSDEEYQSFREQYPEMKAAYVTSADQLFQPGFRD